jgi:branched-chain amino acid transport system permease protein
MDMDNLVMAAFEIMSFGSIVVLVVLGLGIIASMMGIFNFAQGEFVLLGAYITYLIHSAGLPVVVGGLGFVLERLIVRRFYMAPIVAMLGTFALGLIIREIVRGLIGGLYLSVPEPLGGSISVGNLHFATWRCVIVMTTALVMYGSYALLGHTSLGLRVRASLENPDLARASGISTGLIYGVTFAFGAALAGLAGALIVPVFSLFADLGIRFLIQGFVAVMVGGIGSFVGPVVGAGVIGTLSAALP